MKIYIEYRNPYNSYEREEVYCIVKPGDDLFGEVFDALYQDNKKVLDLLGVTEEDARITRVTGLFEAVLAVVTKNN